MHPTSRVLVLLASVVVVLVPAPASADSLFSPWIAAVTRPDPAEGRRAVGITAGGMYGGVIGGELDAGFYPDFFDQAVDNSALTLMGNLIVGVPIGGGAGPGLRPYGSGGVGLIRTQIDTATGRDDAQNDFGLNLGGGVMGFFSEHFGVRGDVRYFRSLVRGNDPDDLGPVDLGLDLGALHFWRASIGIVIR